VDSGWAVFLSAVVAGAFSVLVTVIQKFKKDNASDHEVVMGMLKMVYKKQGNVEDKIDRVDSKLDRHIESHR
jgi:hypothetical protein